MGLVALEFLVRAQVRIAVAQSDHEADRDLVVLEVVEKRSAVGVRCERPAGSVDDEALPVLLRPDFPQLLHPQAVDLRVGAGAQVVAFQQLLAEMTAATFGKERIAGMELHAHLVVGGWLAVAPDAHAPGGDAEHRAVLGGQRFRGGEPGEDLDAQFLRLLPEPAADVGEAHHVIAVVAETARQSEVRHLV
ncbi:hypothetical protein D3C83_06910 [compost metagenome]